jgi:hypothetical protein
MLIKKKDKLETHVYQFILQYKNRKNKKCKNVKKSNDSKPKKRKVNISDRGMQVFYLQKSTLNFIFYFLLI